MNPAKKVSKKNWYLIVKDEQNLPVEKGETLWKMLNLNIQTSSWTMEKLSPPKAEKRESNIYGEM